jgi:sigma-54 dependent transcriptional regulator, acetoin dehydrogenase operon transcriptional activator AcoR
MLFDASGRVEPVEVPLWSGLTLQVLARGAGASPVSPVRAEKHLPLKDLEAVLIRKAVDEARGNVLQAARTLGISRATVYRKLGRKP